MFDWRAAKLIQIRHLRWWQNGLDASSTVSSFQCWGCGSTKKLVWTTDVYVNINMELLQWELGLTSDVWFGLSFLTRTKHKQYSHNTLCLQVVRIPTLTSLLCQFFLQMLTIDCIKKEVIFFQFVWSLIKQEQKQNNLLTWHQCQFCCTVIWVSVRLVYRQSGWHWGTCCTHVPIIVHLQY